MVARKQTVKHLPRQQNLWVILAAVILNPNVSKNREVMKSKAQTGNRRGRPGKPWTTKRIPGWNAAIRACRF